MTQHPIPFDASVFGYKYAGHSLQKSQQFSAIDQELIEIQDHPSLVEIILDGNHGTVMETT